jgi:hypothetical protein
MTLRPTWATLWAGEVTQVVERLPSKCEALSSNPSTVPFPPKKVCKVTPPYLTNGEAR